MTESSLNFLLYMFLCLVAITALVSVGVCTITLSRKYKIIKAENDGFNKIHDDLTDKITMLETALVDSQEKHSILQMNNKKLIRLLKKNKKGLNKSIKDFIKEHRMY